HSDDLAHELFVETHIDDFGKTPILFDVGFQNQIENLVRWQEIRVQLIRTYFRRWRFIDDDARNPLASRYTIAVLCEMKHRGFHHILQYGETTGHISVKRAVATAHFTLISGAQYQPSEFIR